MEVQSKIKHNNRKWELTIPTILMRGMNWKDDLVKIEAFPNENYLKVINQLAKPLTDFEFISNIQDYKFEKNPKKYQEELNENLSPDGREILHSTNWDEVDEGGYINIKYTWDVIIEIKKIIKKTKSDKIKQSKQRLMNAYLNDMKTVMEFLKEKGGKEPSWFSPWFNSIKKDYESLNRDKKLIR